MTLSLVIDTIKEYAKLKKINWIPTHKNRQFLITKNLTLDDIYSSLAELSESNYISGPQKDRDKNRAGEVWIFGKIIYQEQIYIKIKFELDADNTIKCLSFHIAEHELF